MTRSEGQEEEVLYLGLEDVLALYAELFGCTDQEAADQLRSAAGLDSGLMRPQTYAFCGNADLAHQAATLAHGIAEGQYLIEGQQAYRSGSDAHVFAH